MLRFRAIEETSRPPGKDTLMGSLPFLEAGNGKDRKADLCGWVVKQSTWARAP